MDFKALLKVGVRYRERTINFLKILLRISTTDFTVPDPKGVSAEELAETLYSIVIRSAHYYPNAKLKEAIKKDDFDEAAFQYLSDVIAYNNRYL